MRVDLRVMAKAAELSVQKIAGGGTSLPNIAPVVGNVAHGVQGLLGATHGALRVPENRVLGAIGGAVGGVGGSNIGGVLGQISPSPVLGEIIGRVAGSLVGQDMGIRAARHMVT